MNARALVQNALAAGALLSCASSQEPLYSEFEAPRIVTDAPPLEGDASEHTSERASTTSSDAALTDASGPEVQLTVPRVAIRADAGIESGELAWQLAHLADDPDQANLYDSEAVRQVAARGARGVQAVLPLLRRGDARRAPFARTVIERVARRACGVGGRPRLVTLTRWFELGTAATARMLFIDAGASLWLRSPTSAWAPEALVRVQQWADNGAPCESAPTSGTGLDAGQTELARMDAGNE